MNYVAYPLGDRVVPHHLEQPHDFNDKMLIVDWLKELLADEPEIIKSFNIFIYPGYEKNGRLVPKKVRIINKSLERICHYFMSVDFWYCEFKALCRDDSNVRWQIRRLSS